MSDSATPWTVAYQAPLSMAFPRQEYWSGWPSPSPGNLPDPGIEPGSPAFQADSLSSEPPEESTKDDEIFGTICFETTVRESGVTCRGKGFSVN